MLYLTWYYSGRSKARAGELERYKKNINPTVMPVRQVASLICLQK